MKNRSLKPLELFILSVVCIAGGAYVMNNVQEFVGSLAMILGYVLLLFAIVAGIRTLTKKK